MKQPARILETLFPNYQNLEEILVNFLKKNGMPQKSSQKFHGKDHLKKTKIFLKTVLMEELSVNPNINEDFLKI